MVNILMVKQITSIVLILVLVEDGLRDYKMTSLVGIKLEGVLILVLVEDGLRAVKK